MQDDHQIISKVYVQDPELDLTLGCFDDLLDAVEAIRMIELVFESQELYDYYTNLTAAERKLSVV